MTESIRDTLYYIHNGRMIKKTTWADGNDTWDTFDDQGGSFDWLPDGTVVNPQDLAGDAPAQDQPDYGNTSTNSPGMDYQHGSTTDYRTRDPRYAPSTRNPADTATQSSYAAPNSGRSSMPEPNAFNPNAGGSGLPQDQQMLDAVKFNPWQAQTAMQQAMMQQGRNPFSNTIYNKMMQRAAPGLGLTYMMQQAQNPNMTSAVQGAGGFKDYLMSALGGGGGGGGGNIFDTLSGAAQQLPNFAQFLRDQNADPGSAMQQNPFASALYSQLSDWGGQGIQQALAALNGPLMPQQLLQGYQGGLRNASASAFNQLGAEDDIFQYLLGI